jgi:hypothetical protein
MKEISLYIVKQCDGRLKFVFSFQFMVINEPLELDCETLSGDRS